MQTKGKNKYIIGWVLLLFIIAVYGCQKDAPPTATATKKIEPQIERKDAHVDSMLFAECRRKEAYILASLKAERISHKKSRSKSK